MFDINQNERAAFLKTNLVSREAREKLDRYAALLSEWNEKFNLVAPSTIPHLWTRHFLDSAQLMPLIHQSGQAASLADMGSGAGFPGLILSILGLANVHLIESIGKKAQFLQAVIEDLGLSAKLHHTRAEDIKGLKVDIITARAVASLQNLLSLARPLLKADGIGLFLKGQNVEAELTEAQKYWMFACDRTPSLSDPSGVVLTIRDLKHAKQHPQHPYRQSKS